MHLTLLQKPHRAPIRLVYYVSAYLTFLFFLLATFRSLSTTTASIGLENDSMNSTLGFEKIFYISLPQCVPTIKSLFPFN